MSLGKRLKYEREDRNWSQKFVAEKLGITNTVLSNYERDYRDPDTENLRKIAELYDVSVDYLLGLTNNRNAYNNVKETTECEEYESLTDEEKDYLKLQLEIFRKIKEKDGKNPNRNK